MQQLLIIPVARLRDSYVLFEFNSVWETILDSSFVGSQMASEVKSNLLAI